MQDNTAQSQASMVYRCQHQLAAVYSECQLLMYYTLAAAGGTMVQDCN
jgi:hypothetical protein